MGHFHLKFSLVIRVDDNGYTRVDASAPNDYMRLSVT